MATTPTQVRIDANIKKETTGLFSSLGLDMSGAVFFCTSAFFTEDFRLLWKCPSTAIKH